MNHVFNRLRLSSCPRLPLIAKPLISNPKHMLALYHKIKEEADNYDGVVITHGTDTLEKLPTSLIP